MSTLTKIPASKIQAGTNDRKSFDPVELQELADSIALHGLAQPPTLRPVNSHFEIVAGERRCRAMALLGWSEYPAIVRDMSDREASAVMLAENLNRSDLDPIEEARAYQSRIDRFADSIADVAKTSSVGEKRVRERLALLKLNPEIAQMVSRKLLPLSFAGCMVRLDVNRQRLAIHAYDSKRPDVNTFRALCGKLQLEQDQDSFFDDASFLQVEEMVANAEEQCNADVTLVDLDKADPVGLSEIAERLGVKLGTVSQWKHRGLLPAPRWTVGKTDAWNWEDVREFARKTGRLPQETTQPE